MKSAGFAEIDALIAELCEQSIGGDELERLESLVKGDASHRQYYINMMTLHGLLELRFAPTLGPPPRLPACDLDSSLPVAADGRTVELDRSHNLGRGSVGDEMPFRGTTFCGTITRPGRSLVPLGMAVAAVIFAAAFLWPWLRDDPRKSPQRQYVGVLTKTKGAVWSDAVVRRTPTRLATGESLRLNDGFAEVTLSSGVLVVLRGPVELELVSPMRVRAKRGVVRARVGNDARGFMIETPTTEVVDLGTEFGVDVNESAGTTDVVVFEGAVDLQYVGNSDKPDLRRSVNDALPSDEATVPGPRKRLNSGEALRVDRAGEYHRIVAIRSNDYPSLVTPVTKASLSRIPLITGVTDNIRDPNASVYYEIVAAGLDEDCRAYVDRFHEWNGVDETGIPLALKKADYVMTFNSDKWLSNIEVSVELSAPARLYVLYDSRLASPAWLSERFKPTNLKIGVDEGFDQPNYQVATMAGPGKSIDTVYSVWELIVRQPGIIKLGALPRQEMRASMYGIAAVPLD